MSSLPTRLRLAGLALLALAGLSALTPLAEGRRPRPDPAPCPPSSSAYRSLVTSTAGLAAYWRLDDSGTTACDATGANPGRYEGGYVHGVAGALAGDSNPATSFGGTGGVAVSSSASLNPSSQLTLEAWVNPASTSVSQTVARKEGQYLLRLSNGSIVFRVWSGGIVSELSSASVLQAGVYQHLVATYDGAALRVYRNGSQVASRGISGGISTSGNPLFLARSSGYDYLRGSLDEVAVYGGALSADQIQQHYAAGAPAEPPPPVETTPPAATSCAPTWGSFGVDNWPAACWRPYADGTPFNDPLPANPRIPPNSGAIVANLTASGGPSAIRAGTADTTGDWSHPTYYPSGGDPLFTIHCTRSWGTCEVEGMQVRIPSQARPAGGGDGHLTVVDQQSGWEYDLWQVQSNPVGNGGTLNVSWGGRTRIGTADANGLDSDSTAAHFSNLAGVIRAEELMAGRIEHALFVVAKCDNGTYVYPASGLGSKCSDPTNAPAEGQRFQLTLSDSQIQALDVPGWKKAILTAMARYGFYVGDTGGSPWDIQVESGSTYTSFGRTDRWASVAEQYGIPRSSDGRYYLNVASGVDWAHSLRVIDPCVTRHTC